MDTKFICVGDTHGNFKYISYKIKSLGIENMVYLHVGDFGVGFLKKNFETEELDKLNNVLVKTNSKMYVIRGNHDNPSYFNGDYDRSNLFLVPDYTTLTIGEDTVLMVGGAISIDRVLRIDEQTHILNKDGKEFYWEEECFNLDEKRLSEFRGIDYVVTHTSPHFVEAVNNIGIPSHGYLVERFAEHDSTLKVELTKERDQLTKMYEILNVNNDIKKWVMGHFHMHNSMYYDETDFITLDINEFYSIR